MFKNKKLKHHKSDIIIDKPGVCLKKRFYPTVILKRTGTYCQFSHPNDWWGDGGGGSPATHTACQPGSRGPMERTRWWKWLNSLSPFPRHKPYLMNCLKKSLKRSASALRRKERGISFGWVTPPPSPFPTLPLLNPNKSVKKIIH